MRITRIASVLVPLLTAALTASPASATSFIERPFPESVEDAPIIVRGRAGRSQADYGAFGEGGRRIYTYTELEITEVLKGAPGASRIRIRELGGEKNGIGMHVSGTARFEAGEDLVIFLEPKSADGSFPVRSMMMGKFNLSRDDEGREVLIGPGIPASDAHAEQPENLENPEKKEGRDDTAAPPKWTLDSLRSLIKEQAKAPAESKNAADSPTPAASPAQSPFSSPQAPRLQPQLAGELEELGEDSRAAEPSRFPNSVRILVAIALGAVAWVIARARGRKH